MGVGSFRPYQNNGYLQILREIIDVICLLNYMKIGIQKLRVLSGVFFWNVGTIHDMLRDNLIGLIYERGDDNHLAFIFNLKKIILF